MSDVGATTTKLYTDSSDLIVDELRRLDLLLERRVLAMRSESNASSQESETHHLYITDDEVDRLLRRNFNQNSSSIGAQNTEQCIADLAAEIEARTAISAAGDVYLALDQLQRMFGLTAFDRLVVVLCLAPELDRKYDRLYAYLQDDITRKRPSVDLALNLMCCNADDRWRQRAAFSNQSLLFRARLIEPVEDSHSLSGSSDLARFIRLDRRCLDFLFDQSAIDGRLEGIARLLPPLVSLADAWVDSSLANQLLRFLQHHLRAKHRNATGVVVHLCGPRGVGKTRLAQAICTELGLPLLAISGEVLAADNTALVEHLRLGFREGLLLHSGVLIEDLQCLEDDPKTMASNLRALADVTSELGGLTFLTSTCPSRHHSLFSAGAFASYEIGVPQVEVRRQIWESILKELPTPAPHDAAELLAQRFSLTPGQIRNTVQDVAACLASREVDEAITVEELSAACRRQSSRELDNLATRIEPRYSWNDLILPVDRLEHLHEICAQFDLKHRVFSEWGFGKKLAHGKGLSVLFSGPPGTGKTMAAEVIANALELDLYKVDLSGIVSKYIGETEKNLSRIFDQAETGNAILFFDEADALFGKRTEVVDAHDRYANIETSYLLQKMEEYEGMVILASNLRQNMDDAFLRRLRFIVQFPFPKNASRREIWRAHLPQLAPCSDDINLDLLADDFRIAGGNIKNIVLNAAFLAANDGGEIAMRHLMKSARREFEKIGKLWTSAEGVGADV